MRYQIFNTTKEIELDDKLVEVYEECVHNIDSVSLQGMIAACGLKNADEQEISAILTKEMLDSIELYKERDDIIDKYTAMTYNINRKERG